MKKSSFFRLQTKRIVKHYPTVLAITVLLIAIISLSCFLIIQNAENDDSKQRVKIGIAGDLSHTYLNIGITALQNLDNSKIAIEFITYDDEGKAVSDLENKKLAGYIKVPENFVESLMGMENKAVTYVTNDSPMGIGTILTNEVAKTISDIVTQTQKGIYGMQRLSYEYDKKAYFNKNIDKLNAEYISSIFKRSSLYQTEYIGKSNGLSTGGYFVCGGIMIFMMLFGIPCHSILFKKDRSIEKLLISKGMSPSIQIISEFVLYFLSSVLTFLFIFLIAGIFLQNIKMGIAELDSFFVSDYLIYGLKIIPVIALVCSVQFLLYEICTSHVSVILSQFLYALGTGYICGCLYPSYFFPTGVQSFAKFLPTGVGLTYMQQTLSNRFYLRSFINTVVYTAIMLIFALAVRKHRHNGKE